MPDRDRNKDDKRPTYSAQRARQGDIVLRKPWERVVFITGLVGAIVLAFVLVLVGAHFGRVYSDQQLTHQQTTQENTRS